MPVAGKAYYNKVLGEGRLLLLLLLPLLLLLLLP
jgi:hypothetical protein